METLARSVAETGAGIPVGPSPRPARWPFLATLALGLASLAGYIFGLVRPYSLIRYGDRPLLDLGKIGGYDPAAGLRYTALFGALWLAYLAAGALAARVTRWLCPLAYGGAALFSIVLVGLYPITAADVFNYVLYGLVQHRGANPLVVPPADVIGPPLIDYSAWPDHPSPYGPAWQWIAFAVTGVTGERLLAGILAFKLVLAGCHLLNTILVARIAAGSGTVRPAVAALWYGWNPLILYETVGNGHNDVVTLTALLLALWALTRPAGARALALPLTMLGVLSKYVAGLWLPPLALALWRVRPPSHGRNARTWSLLVACGACVALAALSGWPFWAGGETFTGVRRQSDLYTTSFGALAMVVLVERRQMLEASALLDGLKAAMLVALALTVLVRRPRDGTVEEVGGALFDLTLVYLLVGALWFQPWYLVPLLGLAPLVDTARRAVAVAFALGATGSYVVYFYVWPALDWTPDRLVLQGWAVAITDGPVLLTLAALAASSAWRRRAMLPFGPPPGRRHAS